MKPIIVLATALALAGCNKAADTPAKPNAAAETASMDASASEVKTGNGTGKITEIDATGGKITIAHGAIPSVGWPAMTMGFKADPKILAGVAVGDQVDFDLTLKGYDAAVTAIKKR